ncbi:MAG: chromate efflux transporter [Arenicella sp.]
MNAKTSIENNDACIKPSLMEATLVWAKIGLLSFGGPAAQIALMHKLIVEQLKWLREKDFINALSFCMLLPGPEAMQLAIYAGWKLHGRVGGLIAGTLFVLPGAIIILTLAIAYALVGEVSLIQALFLGVKAAVLIIVIQSLLKISKKALNNGSQKIIALLAFIGIFFLNISYPLIVLAAALFGLLNAWHVKNEEVQLFSKPKGGMSLVLTVLIGLCVWWLPLFAIDYFFEQKILADIGMFFSRLAVVTFGGAYAVLAYMGQDVVNYWGWLSAGEMMDGLGLAETTPGPLILVTEFVGFLAAYREGGLLLGFAGAIITLWVTFVPCFIWIFAGAPYIEWISSQPKLKGALDAISGAVVGVILNLSVWFALHVLFTRVSAQQHGILTLWQPELSSIDWRVMLLTILCGILSLKCQWSIGKVLIASSISGMILVFFT